MSVGEGIHITGRKEIFIYLLTHLAKKPFTPLKHTQKKVKRKKKKVMRVRK